jgi:two-component sensor histidine kinase
MEAAIREGRDYAHEFRIVRPDGEVRWLAGRGTVVGGGVGGPRRMIGVNYDVTDRRRAEEQRELLLAELNHRIKNAFTLVQAIALQTLRHIADLRAFERAFLGRLDALARVSGHLAADDRRGADLRALAEAVVEPHRRHDGSPHLRGPDVALPPTAARTLSLALHELATNAAKYGALSVPEGRVELAWGVAEEGEHRRCLVLEWTEHDDPTVRRPERRGLGRVLIEQALAHELDGTVRLEFPPEGVRCRIEVPLET